MAKRIDHEQLLVEIENLYASAPASAETLIEAYLENRLRSLEPAERVAHLEKLTAILASSSVRAVKVLRMEVPCCSGLTALAEAALRASGKDLLLEEIIIEVGGKIEKPAINKKEKM